VTVSATKLGKEGIDARCGQLEQFNLVKLGKEGIDVRCGQ